MARTKKEKQRKWKWVDEDGNINYNVDWIVIAQIVVTAMLLASVILFLMITH